MTTVSIIGLGAIGAAHAARIAEAAPLTQIRVIATEPRAERLRAEGVTVCQENVNRFKSQHIAFCDRMRRALGDDFHMVLDIKQAVRAGEDPFAFLDTFQNCMISS